MRDTPPRSSEDEPRVASVANPGWLHRVEHVMGMPVLLDVCDPGIDERVIERVFEWLHFVDATFSTYREDSEISRLNRGELQLADTHAAVRSVLARCERLRTQTDGYFDIRSPYAAGRAPSAGRGGEGSVEPSGLVKGWALLGAGRLLGSAGARNFSVNAGGDVLVRGRPIGEPAWRIGIQHPRLRDGVAMVLALTGGSVATSGAYQRGEHIVNPHTGSPPTGVLSVTIVGPDPAIADAYATAAFAMGRRGAQWCADLDGYDAIVICSDDTVLTTPGLDRFRVSAGGGANRE
jgi:thiamine biosynthesis lipoprotein